MVLLKTFSKKQMRFFILFAIVVIVLIIVGYLMNVKKNTKYYHIDKDYFKMTSKVEVRDIPWTIHLEEAKKIIGELDTTFDVDIGKGIKVQERLMPKKQIYIEQLDVSTEAIRLMFNLADELISIDYYFSCESFEEADKLFDALNAYLSKRISTQITKKDINGRGVKWVDDEGNSLTMSRSAVTSSPTEPRLELNFLSADHRIIYPND